MRAWCFAVLAAIGCGKSSDPPALGGTTWLDASTAPDSGSADAASEDASTAVERTLFIGNSFTYVNDLPGTYVALSKTIAGRPSPFVDSVAYGGYTLAQHLADAQGTGSNPRVVTLLGTGDAGRATWSHVVLQEQSEIPGFATNNPERVASMSATVALSAYVAATGATSVMYMTWGFPTGDPANPTLYPDYLTMQRLLEDGYRAMAHAIATAGRSVVIAPVGLAFQAAYQRDVAGGRNPNAAGSLFASLYGPDAKHPAPPGTYVAACVMAATIEGVDPTSLSATVAGVDAATASALQVIARDVVAAERARPPP